jgi:uncharacterized protein YggE
LDKTLPQWDFKTPCPALITRFIMLSRPLVLALLVLAPLPALASDDDGPGLVAVTGEGSAHLAPDMAILILTVMRQEETARAALDANSAAMAQVLEAMKADGIAERDLQTSGFSINPQYHYPRNDGSTPVQPQIIGYQVANSLTVRVRDLDQLGAIIDKSVTLGVNQGGQIRFTNDDPSAAVTKARVAAVQDAKAKAATLVEAAGVALGRITEISERLSVPQPLPMARMQAEQAFADAAVPVASGENEYKVNVNVTFEIDQ